MNIGIGIGIGMSSMGGALWAPSQLSGQVLWLRSDSLITLNGSDISDWGDKSGNGNDAQQHTAANQPGYVSNGGAGGKPYLNFVAANTDRMFVPDANSLDLATNVAVVLVVSDIANVDCTWLCKGRSGVGFNYAISQLGTNQMVIKHNGGNTGFQDLDTTGDMGLSTGTMVLAHWDNNDQVFRVDADRQTGAAAITLATGTFDLDIGALSSDPGPTYSGHMTLRLYEVIVYNRRLTLDEELLLKGYTATRYGAA